MSALFVFGVWLALGVAAAEEVRVLRAPDGDSLLLADGRAVRLIGINTPELGKDGAPHQPLAAKARQRTHRLVGGQIVRLEYDRERHDRYGRVLAYAFLPDGRDLQELLLRDGLAWFVAIPPNLAHLDAYRAAEAQARAAGRGIWQQPEYGATPANNLERAKTGFRLVSGAVQQLHRRGDAMEMRLAPRVSLLISPEHYRELPQPLRGKRVLARGWLTEYKNGLRMRITHPAMLDVQP